MNKRFKNLRLWHKILLFSVIIGSTVLISYYTYPYLEKEAEYEITLEEPLHAVSDVPIGTAVDVHKLRDHEAYRSIVQTHFNSLTAENHMKWMYIQPEQGEFHWEAADYIVDFAEEYDMVMHGHCLVWHEQLPQWVLDFEGTPAEWNNTLKTHIQTLAGQYEGRIETWDVVNEAFLRNGFRDTIWYQHLGEDYIKNAFLWAHEADPDAKLYYNDYNILGDSQKLDVILDHLGELIAEGVPIYGIGFQAHISLDQPSVSAIQIALARAEALGLDIRISELDIQVNPRNYHRTYTQALADAQCKRYAEVTLAFTQSDALTGITTWGVSDADSWIPWHTGRREWVLLFDMEYQPKPAALCFQDALWQGFSKS